MTARAAFWASRQTEGLSIAGYAGVGTNPGYPFFLFLFNYMYLSTA